MNTFDCILKRRSIRKFKNQKVEEEKITKLLKAAMAAPSAKNTLPWEFYVVKSEEIKEKIKLISPAYGYNPDIMIIVGYDVNNTLSKSSFDFAFEDCTAALENILLEATELGLGSVWCGIYPKEDRVAAIQEALGVKPNIIPLGLVEIGYPDEEKEPRTQYNESKVHIL